MQRKVEVPKEGAPTDINPLSRIPWRDDKAVISKDDLLSFAVLRHDGSATPHPPVQRAISTAVEALEKQGHKVIEWHPPDHARGINIILKAWTYDNGADICSAFALSGEPMIPQVVGAYSGDKPPEDATYIAANNVAQREYQKEYMEYWNSSAELTGTGRPVDVVIAPVCLSPLFLFSPFSLSRMKMRLDSPNPGRPIQRRPPRTLLLLWLLLHRQPP